MGPDPGTRGAHELSANIVFVTQVIDPADPVLGFVIRLIRALDQRTDAMLVIANEVRDIPPDLGVEVLSLGKDLGHSRLSKGIRYQRILANRCRRQHPPTLLAHMCPTYLTLAAPIIKAAGGRSLLWFTHLTDSPRLRRAEWFADAVLTALPGSYPRPTVKVRAIGHSIDTDQFRRRPVVPRSGPLRLLALGRTGLNKNYPVVIKAVKQVRDQGVDVHLRIVGPSTTASELAHRRELDGLVQSLGLAPDVTIEPGVGHHQIPDEIAAAHALVSATQTGSADKVVFEAMSSGRPPLLSNSVFADLVTTECLRLRFRENDVGDLADAIRGLADVPATELDKLGAELRQRIERGHSLNHWADEIVRVATDVRR